MRKLLYLTLFWIGMHSIVAYADQLIIEPDMGRQPIINVIEKTKHQLHLVMYGFTDETLLNALLRENAQGKSIKVILERTPYKAESENNKIINQFDSHHVAWHGGVPPMQLIHQKTLIIDEREAIVMTFNFTKSSFKNERNFGLIIDDPKRVREISDVFSADWNHVATSNHSPDLIWSPDNSREGLLTLIGQAKQSIQIYAQSVNDYKVTGALAKAAKKGVKINILTSAKLRQKQSDFLTSAGVNVHQSPKLYIHAKVFIIDNKKAVLGSINLTQPSIEKNRELAVVTEDPDVIKQLNNTFNKDWNATSGSAIASSPSSHHLTKSDKKLIAQSLRLLEKYVKHWMAAH